MADTAAIIVAAGRGQRARRGERGGGDIPKQYQVLAGKPVLRWAVEAFLGHGGIDAASCSILQLAAAPRDRTPCAMGLKLSQNGCPRGC